jgi:hypothetical protein
MLKSTMTGIASISMPTTCNFTIAKDIFFSFYLG